MTAAGDLPALTMANIDAASRRFREAEPRDLFYRVSTRLLELAAERDIGIDPAECLAMLLQTWNRDFYRFHGPFTDERLTNLTALLAHFKGMLEAYRQRRLEGFGPSDEPGVAELFTAFEMELGKVGAAKALHLLAPEFFPLWDARIAQVVYHVYDKGRGFNAPSYLKAMRLIQQQVANLGGWSAFRTNPLKAIDEFNYVVYTKRWPL
jgi:hypothetical protein